MSTYASYRKTPGGSGVQGPGNVFGSGARGTRRSKDHIDARSAMRPNAAEAGRADQSVRHSGGRGRAAGPTRQRGGPGKPGAAGG